MEKLAASKNQEHQSAAVGCGQDMELNGSGDEFLKNSWTRAGVRSMTDGAALIFSIAKSPVDVLL